MYRNVLLCITVLLTGKASGQSVNYCSTTTDGGKPFIPDDGCYPYYYQCVGGTAMKSPCPGGLAFNSENDECDHPANIEACKVAVVVDCKDKDGNPVPVEPYTKPEDCNNGIYYTCNDGTEVQNSCGTGLIFDTTINQCNYIANIPHCDLTTTAKTTTTIAGKTTTPSISVTTTTSTTSTHATATTTTKQPLSKTTATSTTKNTLSTTTSTTVDYCSTSSHGGSSFIPDDGCYPYYYQCVGGSTIQQPCPDGLFYNSAIGGCDIPGNVESCKDTPGVCSENDPYTKPTDCNSGTYYACVNGFETELNCAPGLIYNPSVNDCDWPHNIPNCSETTTSSTVLKTTPVDNTMTTSTAKQPSSPTTAISITKDSTISSSTASTTADYCSTTSHGGIPFIPDNGCYPYYYQCVGGSTVQQPCPGGLFFNNAIGGCDIPGNVEACKDTTTTNLWKTTTTTNPPIISPDATPATTSRPTNSKTTGSSNPIVTQSTANSEKTTNFISTTTRKPTTTKPADSTSALTYVGFVVDDTGSMYNEMTAVQEWITNCINGAYESCGSPPTGGWIVESFNDPTIGTPIGPTTDVYEAINAVDALYAHGGGDCPERSFSGIEAMLEAVPYPPRSGGCKIFFFTDAIPNDDTASMNKTVTDLFNQKGCNFIPILTGCCGPCPDTCESLDPDYCVDHVTDDSTSSRRKRSTKTNTNGVSYYFLAENTGGNIYITDKPTSSEEMLDFLEEEVTMGFCPTEEIAGPDPDGYKCEADCVSKNMCWDRSVSTCYCNGTIPCAYDPVQVSQCDGVLVVNCSPDVVEAVGDPSNCVVYHLCVFGTDIATFSCANGTVFSEASPSYCDHPYNVLPPCGTKTETTETIH